MPAFVHYPLLWGLLLVGVPVLIHLINMLRHRRVQWAAMEFLLQSQKKNRTWIMLKQLLLLLLRMLAVAAVVLIVAQPLLRNRFGNLLGSTKTHHIVLLDDSFSMSDRWANTSALGEAKAVIRRIGTEAARQRQPQTFTLLRFSRVARIDRGTQPDLLAEPVDTDFSSRVDEILSKIEVSQTSAGPTVALDAIGQLLGDAADERRIVYLISDFRARQWDDPTDLQEQLLQLNETDAEVHLINCVDRARPNLAIRSLRAAEGIRAAGVPLLMEVTVQNFGTTTAKEVSVLLEEDGHTRPGIKIAEIPPGRAVKDRFLVHFPTAGGHQMTARLESDAVAADNVRYHALDFPADVPVLMIDGSPDARDARFLSIASAPGGSVRTGINPQIETPRYLSLNPLAHYRAINLLNIERMDRSAVEALEQYISAGGGVSIFLGERCRSQFINDALYRDGEGFFPLPVIGQAELLVDRLEKAPDLQVGDHPIFQRAADERFGFIKTVIIQRYFAAPDGWKPEADSTTRVIARLRNGAPLVVERRFGEGRVVAFLTTAAPVWNNWARNPSFVVAMQDMQACLSRRGSGEVSHRIGSKLELKLDPDQYRPQVRFVKPLLAAKFPGVDAGAKRVVSPGITKLHLVAEFAETDTSGIYEAHLTTTSGAPEVRRYALNVEAEEGDLEALSGPQLATRLDGVDYEYTQAAAFQYTVSELAGYNISQWLLYLLVLLLIGEQILAYSAGYHPRETTRLAPASTPGNSAARRRWLNGLIFRNRATPFRGGVR